MKGSLCCVMAIERNKPYIAMVIVQSIYAGMALFTKAAVSHGMNSYIFVFYRLAFATLSLALFTFFFERNISARLSWTLLCKIFFTSLFGVCGALVFAFIKVPSFSFYQNKISSTYMEQSSKGDLIKGPLIMLAANTVYSFWIIIQAPLVKKYPAKLRFITLQYLFSCIQAAVWGIATERKISSWKLGWDVNLLSVVYCGVAVTGANNWLQVWVIEKKGPVFTSMITPLALIITAIFSAVLLKEIFHLYFGCYIARWGLYTILWAKKKEAELKAIKQN